MKGNKLITSCLFNHPIDGDTFYTWVVEDLLPNLTYGYVVIMDNISFHKRKDTVKAIQDKGCELLFLPAYSPDLNPIEHKWHELKSIRRKHACSIDDLFVKNNL
jgi:transposase